MKIVLSFLGLKGGGEIYSLKMAEALINSGQEVSLILSSQTHNAHKWDALPCRKLYLEISESLSEDLHKGLKLLVSSYTKVRQFIRAAAPDVIYFPMLHRYTPLFKTIVKRTPTVVTLHDPRPHLGEESWVKNVYTTLSCKMASRIVVLSSQFTNDVAKIYNRPVVFLPHGNFEHYIPENYSYKSNLNPTLLFFGRLHKYKGLDFLIDAFVEIRKRMPNAKLTIVGDGPYATVLSQRKDIPAGVDMRFQWVRDDELWEYFQDSSITVLPYLEASQSGVIPISYAFGRPVVATRVGGIPEQVIDGVTGMLVDPGDLSAFVDACIELLEAPDTKEEMGKNAYQYSHSEWNWNYLAEQLVNQFKEVSS